MQDRNIKFKNIMKYAALYSAGFFVAALTLLLLFGRAGASFARLTDGVAQHFAFLVYLRNYLLKLFSGGLSFPMVDFSVGQGFDVIGTLNYYGFGDPVNLLTVLFPEKYLEEMYAFLILFRMYLSGLAFLVYCRTVKDKKMVPKLCGAWLYAFCGFALLGGMKHPMFLNGMIYLPLLLTGLERLLQKNRVRFLVTVVGISFLTNYYFMYMNTVLCGVYLLVRFFGHYREYGIRKILIFFGRVAGAWIWGACLGAVILLPSVYAFLWNARGGESTGTDLFYHIGYYVRLFQSFMVTLPSVNQWSAPGTAAAGFAGALVVLSSGEKEDRRYQIGFVVILLMLCCPIAGRIMNGFSYVTNRWSYGMAFLLSLMTVRAMCSLYEGKKNNRFYLISLAVGMLELLTFWKTKKAVWICTAVFAMTLLVFFFCEKLVTRKKYRAVGVLFSAVVIGSVCWNLVSLFSPSVFYSTKSFAEIGQSLHRLVDESAVLLTKELAGKDQNGRVELTSSLYNRALVSGLYGTAFYYSVVPETMKELYESLGMAAYTRPYVFKGLEERQALLDLLSVQYETREDKNGKIRLEENKDALPLGYTYTQVMSRETYEKMTPLQRQAALLECAVVDEKEMGRFSEKRKISDGILTKSRSQIQSAKKASFIQGKLKGQKGGFLEIEFETKDDTESYLVLKGFSGVRNQRQEHALYVVQGNQKKEIGISGKKAGSSMKREYIAVNLGELPAGKHTCRICFAKKVNARLENMEIQSLSPDAMKKQNRKRAREAMQDIEISTNQITGNITVSGQRILQLAVPFSKGWTARVDGKKTELFSSGIAYMGLKLEEGEHSIELCYCSPWMREGAVLGILAAAGLVVPFPLSGKRKMRGMKHER